MLTQLDLNLASMRKCQPMSSFLSIEYQFIYHSLLLIFGYKRPPKMRSFSHFYLSHDTSMSRQAQAREKLSMCYLSQFCSFFRRHDNQHNGIQHNGIQRKGLIRYTQLKVVPGKTTTLRSFPSTFYSYKTVNSHVRLYVNA